MEAAMTGFGGGGVRWNGEGEAGGTRYQGDAHQDRATETRE